MKNADLKTQLLRAALKLLGAGHGKRLAIGIVLGLILEGVRSAIVAVVSTNQSLGAALDGFGPVPTFAIGIAIAFSPLLWQKRIITEPIKLTFDAMDEAIERAKLGQILRRNAYITVLEKIAKSFSLSESPPIKKITEETAQEIITEGKAEKIK